MRQETKKRDLILYILVFILFVDGLLWFSYLLKKEEKLQCPLPEVRECPRLRECPECPTPRCPIKECPVQQCSSGSDLVISDVCKIEQTTPYLRSPLWWNNGNIKHGVVEDRSYLKFAAESVDTSKYPRRVYFDLGVNSFESSIGWMFKNYPCKFDKVYGWEAVKTSTGSLPTPDFKRKYGDIAEVELGTYVDTRNFIDDKNFKHIDVAKFIREHSNKEDWVVVKMDVEGFEWSLIPHFLETGTFDWIDEFFVEIHYRAPEMDYYGWTIFKQTKEETIQLLKDLQSRKICAHYWP